MPDGTHGKPMPKTDGPLKPFWDHARQGRLAVQQCVDCRRVHFPPGPVCPACLSESQEWVAASGRGTLHSWCEFHHAYWDGVKAELPYNVSMVKLDEGPVLITNLVATDGRPLQLGMPVRAVFSQIAEGVALPLFTLA